MQCHAPSGFSQLQPICHLVLHEKCLVQVKTYYMYKLGIITNINLKQNKFEPGFVTNQALFSDYTSSKIIKSGTYALSRQNIISRISGEFQVNFMWISSEFQVKFQWISSEFQVTFKCISSEFEVNFNFKNVEFHFTSWTNFSTDQYSTN